jgi:hypothetical protein
MPAPERIHPPVDPEINRDRAQLAFFAAHTRDQALQGNQNVPPAPASEAPTKNTAPSFGKGAGQG